MTMPASMTYSRCYFGKKLKDPNYEGTGGYHENIIQVKLYTPNEKYVVVVYEGQDRDLAQQVFNLAQYMQDVWSKQEKPFQASRIGIETLRRMLPQLNPD